jgi:uncharacterized coiled-coil protein SlyX
MSVALCYASDMKNKERIEELERKVKEQNEMLWDLLELVELTALAISELRNDVRALDTRITANRTTIGPDKPNN